MNFSCFAPKTETPRMIFFKYFLILSAIVFFNQVIHAQSKTSDQAPVTHENAAKEEKLKISHLTGDFYVFTTYSTFAGNRVPSNGMYVLTREGAILIDTPWDETQFQPLLDSIEKKHGQKVVLCVSTHSHEDRTAGLEYYGQKGIKTYSSRQTLELCKIKNEKQARFTFEKDTVFTVGNHAFQTFYPGAGHAEDNIVIWFGDAKILYGGCFIKSTESPDLGNLADANPAAWEKSVQKVMKKYPHPAFVIPGHFGWKSNQGLKYTLKLLEKANR